MFLVIGTTSSGWHLLRALRDRAVLFMPSYMRLLLFILGCAVALSGNHAAAQEMFTAVTVIVHGLDEQPQPDLLVLIEDATGQATTLTTDVRGVTETHIVGPTIWIRRVTTADGVTLQMDSNTAEGGLRLPLDGTPLVVAFARDDTLLFRAPSVLDNPAFPNGVEAALVTPTAEAASATQTAGVAPLFIEGDTAPTEGGSMFWLIVASLVLVGVGLGLLVWARARARARAQAVIRRKRGRQ